MPPLPPRPILVTGSHRSGSTWVGRMLASHPRVGYVHEPFNPEHHPDAPPDAAYAHVTPATAPSFIAYLRPLLGFRARPGRGLWQAVADRRRRRTGCRPLMKDPIAFFSAEWLARTFQADAIVLVRHPAAFVSSIKRLGWRFGFAALLRQPELTARYLGDLEPALRDADREQRGGRLDLVDEAALCWRVFHHVVRQYQATHPEWTFLRHEDLSRDPVAEFGRLLTGLGLEMRGVVRRRIEADSGSENPAEAIGTARQMKRNSRANVWNWRTRLTPAEIDRVRRGTEDIAPHFYSDADWDGPGDHPVCPGLSVQQSFA